MQSLNHVQWSSQYLILYVHTDNTIQKVFYFIVATYVSKGNQTVIIVI